MKGGFETRPYAQSAKRDRYGRGRGMPRPYEFLGRARSALSTMIVTGPSFMM